MKCHSCKRTFPTFSSLITHIRKECEKIDITGIYKCGEDACYRYFTDVKQFRKHVNLKHLNKVNTRYLPSTSNEACVVPMYETETTEVATEHIYIEADSEPEVLDNADSIIHKEVLKFISTLYVNPSVSRSSVQAMVSHLQTLLDNIAPSLMSVFGPVLADEESISGSEINKRLHKFNTALKGIFFPFRSEYLRFRELNLLGSFIPPHEVIVGYCPDISQRSNTLTLHTKPRTMQVIQLRQVLKNFFSIDTIWKDVTDYLNHLRGNLVIREENPMRPMCLENVMQGSVWLAMCTPQASDIILPLVVYYDDFEIGNPLGSHAGVHKLGGVYVSLPALPPHLFSLLNNILLLAICHSADKTKYGNKAIFDPVIEELNYLQNKGIFIENKFFKGTVKFKVVAITGDNLGLNSILGFTESFSANKCCRICNIDKKGLQTALYENSNLLRNMTSYHAQLQENDTPNTGIKESCCWLKVTGFDLFQNVAVDPMHDILEGVARYVMTFVINHFLAEGLLKISVLQQRIISFDYGPDRNSKPSNCLVVQGSKVKLKTSASEMLTLIRYFSLIAGFYIPLENKVWKLYIMLRQITDRLLSHRVFSDTNIQLRVIIAEFNQLYTELTKSPLQPKFHFLTHYPTMLMKFGPVRNMWAMRFEAKHRVSKLVARSSFNRVNVCKTLAIKCQLMLNDLFVKNTIPTTKILGKKSALNSGDTVKFSLGTGVVLKYSVTSATIAGVIWQRNSIVTVDIDDEQCLPTFGQIDAILVTGTEEVFFRCCMFETIEFNSHYNAYEVKRGNDYLCFPCQNAVSPCPNTLTLMRGNTSYITSRWYLE